MSEQTNLASLPKHIALATARAAGRSILADEKAIEPVVLDLWTSWMNANIPRACGQSDEEFGKLVEAAMAEFHLGVDEFVESARSTGAPPAPIDGEHAAEGALLLIDAITWVSAAAQFEADMDPLQTLLDVVLPELKDRVEIARRAVSACR